ncbi:MAG: pilus assembly protein PilM, partial [Rhodoglobus sp.]
PVVEIIYEVAGEQLTSIRNTLNYYVNSKPGSVLNRVVVSGGGSQLSGLVRALGDLTGVQVAQAEPLGGSQLASNSKLRPTREQQDSMTTAYALALGSVS